jgi:hypothetical protein
MTAKNLRKYVERPDATFYSWGELYYSTPGTPEYLEAQTLGMIVECDNPKVQERKTLATTLEEEYVDYDVFDEEYEYEED